MLLSPPPTAPTHITPHTTIIIFNRIDDAIIGNNILKGVFEVICSEYEFDYDIDNGIICGMFYFKKMFFRVFGISTAPARKLLSTKQLTVCAF